MAQSTQVSGTGQSMSGAVRRPGWVTFAAVISFIVGVFYALIALSEYANSLWIYGNVSSHVYNLNGSHLLWWAIFDTIIAVLAIGAGLSLLRGGFFGLVVALTGAGFSALRWLFYIPSDPWLAISIVVLNVLVIYGLCASVDYFGDMGGV